MINKEIINAAAQNIHNQIICRNCAYSEIEVLSGGLINCNIKICSPSNNCKPVVITAYGNNHETKVTQQEKALMMAEKIPNVPVQLLRNSTTIRDANLGLVEKDYIEGNTIAYYIENTNLSESKWSTVMNQLGYILGNIHSIPTQNIGSLSRQNYPSRITWKDFFMQRFNDRIINIANISSSIQFGDTSMKQVKDMIPKLIEYADRVSPSLDNTINPVLIHHDFHFLNIIMTEEPQVRAILDWENITGGDSEFDIAFFNTQLYLNRKRLPEINRIQKHFIQGYIKKLGYWPNSSKMSLYMTDCALSYFEAISTIPSGHISDQVNLYAKGQAEIIQEVCQI